MKKLAVIFAIVMMFACGEKEEKEISLQPKLDINEDSLAKAKIEIEKIKIQEAIKKSKSNIEKLPNSSFDKITPDKLTILLKIIEDEQSDYKDRLTYKGKNNELDSLLILEESILKEYLGRAYPALRDLYVEKNISYEELYHNATFNGEAHDGPMLIITNKEYIKYSDYKQIHNLYKDDKTINRLRYNYLGYRPFVEREPKKFILRGTSDTDILQ